jgi:hypothetical protein
MTWEQIRKLHPDLPESSEGWHQHSNGGGWVHESAVIENDSIFIGERVVFRGGLFYDGVFHGGEFHGGLFHGGEFHGGWFRGGVFRGGLFHDGEFHGGWFRGGVFYDGVFRGGWFRGGDDGEFHGGWFRGGVFRGGLFHDGEFHGGWFHGGVFRGGLFHDGEFHGGWFHGGLWYRSPVFISGVMRYNVCEVGPDDFQIGCERGKLSDRATLLPKWFSRHKTPLEMQSLYITAVELIAAKAAQDPIKETQ